MLVFLKHRLNKLLFWVWYCFDYLKLAAEGNKIDIAWVEGI